MTFRSALDGRVSNGGVARYRGLASRHLVPIEARCSTTPRAILLEVETSQSHIRVAEAARTRLLPRRRASAAPATAVDRGAGLGSASRSPSEVTAGRGRSRWRRSRPCTRRASRRSPSRCWRPAGRWSALAGFDELLAEHALRWEQLWDLCSLELERRAGRWSPDRAASPHLPPAAEHLRAHRRPRRRRAGPRPGRRGVPRARLLGRAVHLPLPQPAPARI